MTQPRLVPSSSGIPYCGAFFAIAISGLLSSPAAQAQAAPAAATQTSAARSATPAELAAFSVRSAGVQELGLPRDRNSPFRLSLGLGGQNYTVYLAPHKVRSCTFKLFIDDGKRLTQVEPPPESNFQGAVLGSANSQAAGSLIDGQLKCQIHMGGQTWNVEPLGAQVKGALPSSHIVYRQQDILWPNVHCGVGGTPRVQTGGPAPASNKIHECELAVDCDMEYYMHNGSSQTLTQQAVDGIVNMCDVIFRRDVSVCYKITTTIIRTTAVYTSGPETGCAASGLLQEMGQIWQANHTNVPRDTAHLFSGNGQFSGTIGCAGLGVICDKNFGYGVSRAIGSTIGANVALVAHEIGHNWNAGHCNATPPCYIMCASLGACTSGELKFGASEQTQIIAHRDAVPCLADCGGCQNQASYTYFGTGCKGSANGAGLACVSQNFTGTLKSGGFGGSDVWAMEANGGVGMEVVSVDLVCSANPATSVQIMLYSANGSGEPDAVLATANMQVGTNTGTYTATFSSPVILAPLQPFFVAWKNPGSTYFNAPIMTAGTATRAYFGSGTGRWNLNTPDENWNFQLNCTTTQATPLLFSSSPPALNSTFAVELSQAPPNVLAACFHALTANAGIDLGFIGAPGCRLYFLNDFLVQSGVTNGTGVAQFQLPIPNNSAICGFAFYNQIAVNDAAANQLTFTLTRRGEPVIGN